MAEALLLRHQPNVERTAQLVTGLELPDGTNWRGFNHTPYLQERELALEWPAQKAARVAELYERYLTKPRGEQDSGWNCHSFAATVSGWSDVRWTDGGFPGYMPRKLFPTSATELEDHQPYAISTLGGLQHSVLGLPDSTKNLSVWGLGEELQIANNEVTLKEYRGRFYKHKPPTKIDVVFARLAFINHKVIPASALQRERHAPKPLLQPLLSKIIL